MKAPLGKKNQSESGFDFCVHFNQTSGTNAGKLRHMFKWRTIFLFCAFTICMLYTPLNVNICQHLICPSCVENLIHFKNIRQTRWLSFLHSSESRIVIVLIVGSIGLNKNFGPRDSSLKAHPCQKGEQELHDIEWVPVNKLDY